MAQVPVNIPYRPSAICPPTNLMNMDGFFVVNMGNQFIQASITNTSGGQLSNVTVYIEGISDSGIARTPSVVYAGNIPAGASVPVRFLADFTMATPGNPMVSFIIESDGLVYKRVLKKIFITRVDYNKSTKTYSVVMPQGTMKVNIHKAIMSHAGNCKCNDRQKPFAVLMKDVSYNWIPNPPYAGVRGPYPYEDPWWKIALAILAVLLLAAALLYDYFSDGDLDGGTVSVGGTFDEVDGTVSCCDSVETAASDSADGDLVLQGLYGAAGGAATLAIASDGPDLHYRGQEATPPKPSELTVGENVRLNVNYPVPPNLGKNYKINGDWKYIRTTTGESYSFGAHDERENIHWLQKYEVVAPAIYDRLKDGPLIVKARFQKPDGKYFVGPDLYVTAVIVNTTGIVRRFELKDHGMEADEKPNDGWYTGWHTFRSRNEHGMDPPGKWYLFVFAQDVNTVLQGTKAFDAAHTIGGVVLTTQLNMEFDKPCQLKHDAVIEVV